MSKPLKAFLVFCILLTILWIVGRFTNAIQIFSAPTASNEPTIEVGDNFFASNLVKPERFDFICYYAETPEFGKQIWVHRLCGIEGDTIEIRNGDLFVNNKNADKTLTLSHNYFITRKDFEIIREIVTADENFIQEIALDTVYLPLSDQIVTDNNLNAIRHTLPRNHKDEFISTIFYRPWNKDNFGPIAVPSGKYFVLGDNRHNANDSRYIGFVDKSKFVATVLGR